MKFLTDEKLLIVGAAGMIGSNMAQTAAMLGLTPNICLYDIFEPGLKGDTATNATKPAKVETGCEVRVPLFINEGELIEVDTRDGSYQGRVKA